MAGEALLDPGLLVRLERLQLGTRRRLIGRFVGAHRSPRQGTSLDFADYREYHPGDDFRRIDYQLLARLDVLLIKLFEAEEDLHLRLLVDTSASMATGGKLRQAARVSAALGFVALCARDSVSVHTFPLDRPAPRFAGVAGRRALFDHLSSLRAEGSTDLARATSHLLARTGPPGVTIVVSDLMTPEWEGALQRLPARGGEVVVVHVLAPEDLAPQLGGDVDLVDVETGARVGATLVADTVAAYGEVVEAWRGRVEAACRRSGTSYLPLLATDDIESALLASWRREGVLR